MLGVRTWERVFDSGLAVLIREATLSPENWQLLCKTCGFVGGLTLLCAKWQFC